MRISRVKITNFRNFAYLDIRLKQKNTIVVGENNAGKSNFLHALRLVLDSNLPNSARYLLKTDFWDGLERPFAGNEVRITVEFADFDRTVFEQAALANCFQSDDGKIISSISYIYMPKLGKAVADHSTLTKEDYDYYFCCNEDIESIITDLSFQKFIPIEILPALRNASADLESIRRSPLNRLIERLTLDRDELKSLGDQIDLIIAEILKMDPISKLQGDIDTRLKQMIGQITSIDPRLGFLQTDPDRFLRFLRLFTEGEKRRSLDEIGAGYANILYLVLLLLDAREKEVAVEQATMIIAVEEPEAHLHPHLQRLVFSDLFEKSRNDIPVIITTHSPHIASVAPLEGMLALKKTSSGTVGRNILDAGLIPNEIKD